MRLLTKMRDNWCAGEDCMCPVCSYCFNWGESEAKLRRNWGEQTYNATTPLWSKTMKAWHALVSGTARHESSPRSATKLVMQSDNISRLNNVEEEVVARHVAFWRSRPRFVQISHFRKLEILMGVCRRESFSWIDFKHVEEKFGHGFVHEEGTAQRIKHGDMMI
jgi:hypothetical protein